MHIHSNFSCDGDYEPLEIVKMAKKSDIKAIALTDHNCVKGIPLIVDAGNEYNIEIVPGVEIDTTYMGYNLHVLGYYIDCHNKDLKKLVTQIQKSQFRLIKKIIEKLNNIGISIRYDEVIENTNNNSIPGYMTIAKVVLNNKRNKKISKVYLSGKNKGNISYLKFINDYFKKGKIAYIPHRYPDAKLVIDTINNAGGIPFLAHPCLNINIEKDGFRVIDNLIKDDLKGLEIYSSYHTEFEIKRLKKYSLNLKKELLISAGSDFHGTLKPDIKIGQIYHNDYKLLKKIKKFKNNAGAL